MRFSIDILDRTALAPGLTTTEEWLAWSRQSAPVISAAHPLPECSELPMMMARRLNSGSRLAVNCGLEMLRKHPSVDAIVFSSRHGELERNYRILSELATKKPASPTNFTMSVHNAAVGTLAIIAKSTVPTSSVSAGKESFQQGLFEVLSLLHGGHKCVLFVDFDGAIPDVYQPVLPDGTPFPPYACALVLTKGTQWSCTAQPVVPASSEQSNLPQSLQFLNGLLNAQNQFHVTGDTHRWNWQGN